MTMNGMITTPMNGHSVGALTTQLSMIQEKTPAMAQKWGLSHHFTNTMGKHCQKKRYSSIATGACNPDILLDVPVPNKQYSGFKTALAILQEKSMEPAAIERKLGWQKTTFKENVATFCSDQSSRHNYSPLLPQLIPLTQISSSSSNQFPSDQINPNPNSHHDQIPHMESLSTLIPSHCLA